jgi:hypothetical protein
VIGDETAGRDTRQPGTSRLVSTWRHAITGLLFATGRTNVGFAPRNRTRPEMTMHAIVAIRGHHADLTMISIGQPAPGVAATRPCDRARCAAHALRPGSRRRIGPDYQTNLESRQPRRRKCLSHAKFRPGNGAPATEDRFAPGALRLGRGRAAFRAVLRPQASNCTGASRIAGLRLYTVYNSSTHATTPFTGLT